MFMLKKNGLAVL